MRFAVVLPWWALFALAIAVLLLGWSTYVRVARRLSPTQRALLSTLRTVTLLVIVICLLRPVRDVARADEPTALVALLVDVSRSMRIEDAGASRAERARAVAISLRATLGARFRVDTLAFGDNLASSDLEQMSADAQASDLTGAISALSERYRGRPLAAAVVLSDGGNTGAPVSAVPAGFPVYTVGIGSPNLPRDREVLGLTAGEPRLADAAVDLSVTLTTRGLGDESLEVRLSENGRALETRRPAVPADGVPLRERFVVSPPTDRASVYTIELPHDGRESVAGNNRRSVLVSPQDRPRKILLVEGAPGFEHTFVKRALARDRGLTVDSVVRKGQNEAGRSTYFIQAANTRAAALANGFPTTRAELFQYDALIFGNIDSTLLTGGQLAATAEFVGTRGGGLLVFGARSFERGGLIGTPIEEVLPIDLADRSARAVLLPGRPPSPHQLALTDDGAGHDATRVALDPARSEQRWATLPPLAAVTMAGSARPGAQVLAVTTGASGDLQPLLLTQRYGQGRSMVFAGEASWRWRMLRPASDTSHELIWRQLARWVASDAAPPVLLSHLGAVSPGDTVPVALLVRDSEYRGVSDAEVTMHIRDPSGERRTVSAVGTGVNEGSYAANVRFEQGGVYEVSVAARRGGAAVGDASRTLLVGGVDFELADPQLNAAVLRRVAESTGGSFMLADEAQNLATQLAARAPTATPTEAQDVWHNGWSVALIITLLAAEWVLRRRMGLS